MINDNRAYIEFEIKLIPKLIVVEPHLAPPPVANVAELAAASEAALRDSEWFM